ncbi:aromatic amino acid ammonia-lyase [Aspergillus tanneri]|uniref:Phenylalanine ammonia-lyase n=1 Tax=Aspergillus tanneri TaxID=1220188 RepID=A0A5M9N6M1_9EURO|nr:uncharacterized protein ATNIH1004_001654 [Aspergillus tanneri]KAA8652749.1 hypothetical protein ATNIH1004_001654 [Aspergillus tanneri]
MLTRCNSLLRGHSAVRPAVVQHILTLLAHGMTPILPLRGSISASGDLTPLAYIAGAVEGNPDISVHKDRDGSIVPADEALRELGLSPLEYGPKEGLGLLNGTAFSAGAASLVLVESTQLLLLSQVLTAMGTEALRAPASRPQIENLALSLMQVEIELNWTTDNPLLDPTEQRIHHGGNFQAAAVTSAMEKALGALQMLGKILSFAFKGVDINMAAYLSELGYLSHPVSKHVQSAEMHNQALNSLAFLACRYTADAVEVLSLMAATYLYVLCQALDLRALHQEFESTARASID